MNLNSTGMDAFLVNLEKDRNVHTYVHELILKCFLFYCRAIYFGCILYVFREYFFMFVMKPLTTALEISKKPE